MRGIEFVGNENTALVAAVHVFGKVEVMDQASCFVFGCAMNGYWRSGVVGSASRCYLGQGIVSWSDYECLG